MKKKKRLLNNGEHVDKCHERWMERLNRDMADPNYMEEWYGQQCGGCQFYIPLTGKLIEDWGVCSNLKSPLDGKVMFEHDGCDFFSEAIDGWSPIYTAKK